MFQYVVEKITSIFPLERVFAVTRTEHIPILMKQESDLPEKNFMPVQEGHGTELEIEEFETNRTDLDRGD